MGQTISRHSAIAGPPWLGSSRRQWQPGGKDSWMVISAGSSPIVPSRRSPDAVSICQRSRSNRCRRSSKRHGQRAIALALHEHGWQDRLVGRRPQPRDKRPRSRFRCLPRFAAVVAIPDLDTEIAAQRLERASGDHAQPFRSAKNQATNQPGSTSQGRCSAIAGCVLRSILPATSILSVLNRIIGQPRHQCEPTVFDKAPRHPQDRILEKLIAGVSFRHSCQTGNYLGTPQREQLFRERQALAMWRAFRGHPIENGSIKSLRGIRIADELALHWYRRIRETSQTLGACRRIPLRPARCENRRRTRKAASLPIPRP